MINIQDKIEEIPKKPGIYMMKDKQGNIIYVGKSKKLKERVKSYFFNSSNHSRKIQRMVKNIEDIEIIQTETELDALILECELIKKIKPMYNKLMKNDKNYTYIKIDKNNEYPNIEIVSQIEETKKNNISYYGPYALNKKMDEIKNTLERVFKIRSCIKMTKCLNYSLEKCIGPCRKNITREEYLGHIYKLEEFLSQDNIDIIDYLKKQMTEEIEKLNFEKAASISEEINNLNKLRYKQDALNNKEKESILAWIEVDDNYKVYTVYRGLLINAKLIHKQKFEALNKKDYYKEVIGNQDKLKNNDELYTKEEIDFVNILHSYIKYNEDIEYTIIDSIENN